MKDKVRDCNNIHSLVLGLSTLSHKCNFVSVTTWPAAVCKPQRMPKLRLRGKVAPQSCVLERIGSEQIVKGASSLVGSSCCGVNISTSSIQTLDDVEVTSQPWNERRTRPGSCIGVTGKRRQPDVVHWKARVGSGRGGEELVKGVAN